MAVDDRAMPNEEGEELSRGAALLDWFSDVSSGDLHLKATATTAIDATAPTTASHSSVFSTR